MMMKLLFVKLKKNYNTKDLDIITDLFCTVI